MNNINEIAEKLDKIFISEPMMLAIDNPTLQIYIALSPDDSVERTRLDRRLELFFHAQLKALENGQGPNNGLSEVLERLSIYTRYSQVILLQV